MKKSCQFLLLLLISCILYECSKHNIIESDDYSITLKVEDKLLKPQDSTNIEVIISTNNNSDIEIKWTTNIGTIIGDGCYATFYASTDIGDAIIEVEIINSFNDSYFNSTKLLIYKQLILLKADDMRFDSTNTITTKWRRFINYINDNNIKASIGLIGESLEKGNQDYYNYLKALASSDNFEIWNHGYNHILSGTNQNGELYHEFWNTTLEYQREHLQKTQDLAQDKLGILLHTFGAPGNAFDDSTLIALNELDDIKVWYFGSDDFVKMNLQRYAEIEFPTHHPDFEQFISNYDEQKTYLALQVHPNNWNNNLFLEFENIIDFLLEHDVTFILPYEYYQLLY